MCSPVPYSKPKRRLLNKFVVKFATAPGSFVYSPIHGKVTSVRGVVHIENEKGFFHTLTGVKLNSRGQVRAGDRIGIATGRKVIYTRYFRNKIIDAMPAVERNDGPKPKKYMPGVRDVGHHGEAGIMGPGNERKVVWHTSESGNDDQAIFGVAEWVKSQGSEYTIAWNPYTGQFLQFFPADVGARAVMNGYSIPANRHGKVCIQVCVIGRGANSPLSKSPMKGRRRLMEWLDSWGIPREDITNNSRSVDAWTRDGHTTHRSAPKPNDHTDPGKINFKKLFAP